MQVTPLGFGTLTGLLSAQDIPLVLLLEGGYFLESIGECSTHVLKALIDRVIYSFIKLLYLICLFRHHPKCILKILGHRMSYSIRLYMHCIHIAQ
jgi:hypothetical protein